ncbi:MAG: FAD-dependent monooxygenase [Opitutales bacterium]|nr:FAD-dependent monooxygenase [Opitutales bacterium]
MFNKRSTDIAVLGAGPVGLAASHGLLANGVEHCLFEQAGGVHSHSYALALHPNTMERLHGLGLSERILAHALRVERIAVYDREERKLELNCSQMAVDYPFITVIGQNHLEEILATALEQRRHAPLWHHRGRLGPDFLDSMRLEVDRLYTGITGYAVAHWATQVDKTYNYDLNYVLGTDGLESSVRRLLGAEFYEQGPAQEYAVFEFKVDGELPQELRLILADDKTHVFWPMPDGYCRWSFQVPSGHLLRGQREGTQSLVQQGPYSYPLLDSKHLAALLDENAPWFKLKPGQIRWRTVVRFQNRLADRFGAGRLWIAGDAAHTGPPAGMLSMNNGICAALDWVDCLVRGRDATERETAMAECAEKWRERWLRSFLLETVVKRRNRLFSWLGEHMHQLAGNIPLAPEQVLELLEGAELPD